MSLDMPWGTSEAPGLGTMSRKVPRPRNNESYHLQGAPKARGGIHEMTKMPSGHK